MIIITTMITKYLSEMRFSLEYVAKKKLTSKIFFFITQIITSRNIVQNPDSET